MDHITNSTSQLSCRVGFHVAFICSTVCIANLQVDVWSPSIITVSLASSKKIAFLILRTHYNRWISSMYIYPCWVMCVLQGIGPQSNKEYSKCFSLTYWPFFYYNVFFFWSNFYYNVYAFEFRRRNLLCDTIRTRLYNLQDLTSYH